MNKNGAAATLSYYNYTYDNADRVSNHTWSSQIGTVTYSGSNTYTYDATSQLLNDGPNNYSYDSNGNRTMSGYATGTDNRMTNDGTYTYTYDAADNMTQKSKGSGLETWYYGYDTRNNLTSIRERSDGTTNTLTVTYTYDVQNKRVKEQTWHTGGSTVETRFAFDGNNVWADLDSSNTILVRRLFDDGAVQPLTRTVASGSNAGVWIYLTDNLGSIRDLVNWSGQVQDHLDYSGFGVLTESTASVGDAYAYTGLKEQKAAGVLLADERTLLVTAGRWMQQDPIVFRAGDANLYRYTGNTPTNAIDPSGLSSLGDLWVNVGSPILAGLNQAGDQFIDTVQQMHYVGSGAFIQDVVRGNTSQLNQAVQHGSSMVQGTASLTYSVAYFGSGAFLQDAGSAWMDGSSLSEIGQQIGSSSAASIVYSSWSMASGGTTALLLLSTRTATKRRASNLSSSRPPSWPKLLCGLVMRNSMVDSLLPRLPETQTSTSRLCPEATFQAAPCNSRQG